jgi:hypothetical protein
LNDTILAEQVLYSLLSPLTDSVHADVAPQGAAYPHLVFQKLSDQADTMVQEQTRLMAGMIYLVKAIVEGEDKAPAASLAHLADLVLHEHSAEHEGHLVDITRIAPFSLPVVDGDRQYRQVGGRYRVLVRPIDP